MRKFIPLFLFIAVFVTGWIVSPKIGPSWDEPDNIYAGGIYLTFFQKKLDPKVLAGSWDIKNSAYGDRIYTQQANLERYPPFPLIFGSFVTFLLERLHTATPQEIIGYFHVASSLFLGLLAVAVYLLGRRLGLRVLFAAFAAGITVFLPTVFGHGLSTIKDIGQMSLFAASLTALVTYTLTKKKWPLVLGGVLWGMGMATKFNAIYVPVIWGIWATLYDIPLRKPKEILPTFLKYTVIPFLGFFLIGFLILFISWPFLWFDPVKRIELVIQYFTTVGTGYKVVFNGADAYVGGTTPVWWYPIGYLLLVTPVPFLLFFVLGIGTFVIRTVLRKKESKTWLVILIWFSLPLARAFLPKSAYYDGIRHFMEILPAMVLLTLYGIQRLVDNGVKLSFLKSQNKVILGILSVSIPLFLFVQMVAIDAQLFPYSSGYLNFFAKNQNYGFDRDFSGLTIKEGMDYVESQYTNGVNLFAPIAGHLTWYYVNPKVDRYVYSIYDADTIVFANKSSHVRKAELDALLGSSFKVVYTISRGSSIFGWVYRRI